VFRRIVDLLTPHFESEDARKTLILVTFSDCNVRRQIDFRGSAFEFVVRLVDILSRYEDYCVQGKPALIQLLESLREHVGMDKQQRIDAVINDLASISRNDQFGTTDIMPLVIVRPFENFQVWPVSLQPWVDTVFLSSTFQDFREYRDHAADKLRNKLEMHCPLIDYAVLGWGEVVDACRERVANSNIFILFSAYWYGSIPPGSAVSITEMEFEWARNLPTRNARPRAIEVFTPRSGSAAEKLLKQNASEIIVKNGCDEAQHEQNLQRFQIMLKKWHTTTEFSNLQDFGENVLVRASEARNTLQKVAKGEFHISPMGSQKASLDGKRVGAIGRVDLATAAVSLLDHCVDASKAPILALLVSGDAKAGQNQFMRFLISQPAFQKGRKLQERKLTTCPRLFGSYSQLKLIHWLADELGISGANLPQSISEFAQRLQASLKVQNLYIVIDHIERIPGNLRGFVDDIWSPLQRELAILQTHSPVEYCAVLILVDYADRLGVWEPHVTPPSGLDTDFSKIVALKLEKIKRIHLQAWLKKNGVATERLASLIDECLLDPITGDEDGAPEEVYRRLQGVLEWQETT